MKGKQLKYQLQLIVYLNYFMTQCIQRQCLSIIDIYFLCLLQLCNVYDWKMLFRKVNTLIQRSSAENTSKHPNFADKNAFSNFSQAS